MSAISLDKSAPSSPAVNAEYERWKKILLVSGDPYESRFTIGLGEVLQAHFLLIDHFSHLGEGVGGVGPKNADLLHSALSRQYAAFAGRAKWINRIDIAATLMFGLIKNHPFHDANKRTAFLVALLHLQKIGRTPRAPAVEFEDFTVLIADNRLHEAVASERVGHSNPDKEILIISNFLKRKTREINLSSKHISYRELDQILRKHGYELQSPNGNRIDMMKRTSINDPEQPDELRRVAHIGFHGWTKEVSNKDMHTVRNAAKLDPEHGIDSETFFHSAEGPLQMIRKYEEPLRRLAFR